MRHPTVSLVLTLSALMLSSGPLHAQSRASFMGEPDLPGEPPAATEMPAPAEVTAAAPSGASGTSEATVARRDARAFGLSGALRAVVVPSDEELPDFVRDWAGADGALRWMPLAGTRQGALLGVPVAEERTVTPSTPGIWSVAAALLETEPAEDTELAVITRVPFSSKQGTMLNGYHIGRYPTEGSGRTDRYAPPVGFIEVTLENQHFHISENFQLRQFLTKDQPNVWPKYLVLDLRLIDKLELVLQELNEMGVRADRMHVMSGFRTPQYNGPGTGGRAELSRHTYGDGADVWIDNDGNGYMDDLNGDGVVDIADAQVMLRAVERVERKYPELIGGAGLYVANAAHGPFIHIDVRGTAARW